MDERKQWTSASAAEYDQLCPGRHQACLGLPEQQSEDAASGQRIHAALAGQKVDLAPEEQEIFADCQMIEAETLAQWGVVRRYEREIETRLWYRFNHDQVYQHSGKPDLAYIDEEHAEALVIDYKTGRGEVRESPRNMQLRDLAVLVRHNYGVNRVTVAIIQPPHKPELCVYYEADLKVAEADMKTRIFDCWRPDARRVPGHRQCQYCRAKGTGRCPESIEVVNAVIPPEDRGEALDPVVFGKLLLRCEVAETVIYTLRAEAKRRLAANPDAIPGWRLGKPRKTETVTDPQKCFERAAALGVKVEQFLAAVKILKGDLQDAVRGATGQKGAELKATMATLFDGITESKEGQPPLEQIT
jgi:hypothetical protein